MHATCIRLLHATLATTTTSTTITKEEQENRRKKKSSIKITIKKKRKAGATLKTATKITKQQHNKGNEMIINDKQNTGNI